MTSIAKLIKELRWWGNRDDLDHDLCYACDDAADALYRACRLAGALDRYTKDPSARNWTNVLYEREAFK